MEKQEMATMDVIVHKANIALQNGESLQEFTGLLGDFAKEHILQQLDIDVNKGGAWTVDAYSDKVVVCTWQESRIPRYKYHQISYARDKDGKFNFDNVTEVKRVTTFKPAVAAIGVMKSEEAEPQIWEPMDIAPEEPVLKSLFGNIV